MGTLCRRKEEKRKKVQSNIVSLHNFFRLFKLTYAQILRKMQWYGVSNLTFFLSLVQFTHTHWEIRLLRFNTTNRIMTIVRNSVYNCVDAKKPYSCIQTAPVSNLIRSVQLRYVLLSIALSLLQQTDRKKHRTYHFIMIYIISFSFSNFHFHFFFFAISSISLLLQWVCK